MHRWCIRQKTYNWLVKQNFKLSHLNWLVSRLAGRPGSQPGSEATRQPKEELLFCLFSFRFILHLFIKLILLFYFVCVWRRMSFSSDHRDKRKTEINLKIFHVRHFVEFFCYCWWWICVCVCIGVFVSVCVCVFVRVCAFIVVSFFENGGLIHIYIYKAKRKRQETKTDDKRTQANASKPSVVRVL